MARGTTIPKDEATDCNKKDRYHKELKSLMSQIKDMESLVKSEALTH